MRRNLLTGRIQPRRGTPDVSVIIAVYNTMPYLTRCLNSIVQQTIGLERLQIVTVDDGSTDGSTRELERFANRYPGAFTVIRRANSGGPATPSNVGLDHATGRFVFFVGADDYLGPEALTRLVSEADAYRSDVVLGRMIGDNGRYVPVDIFSRTDHDVDLFASTLPFALSNTKLFRRSLLVEKNVRYLEHLRFGSDQPFTLTACIHATRISVLADYDYYFAVRRLNAMNITYRSGHATRLRCTEEIMNEIARLLPPGPQREAVMFRSFSSEISKLTQVDFLALDGTLQARLCAGIGRLADTLLTANIRARLDPSRRLRLSLAQQGSLEDLISVIAEDNGSTDVPLVHDSGRLYRGYKCFRDRRALPDEWFFITCSRAEITARQVTVDTIEWRGRWAARSLNITARSPAESTTLTDMNLAVELYDTTGRLTLTPAPEFGGTVLRIEMPLRQVMAQCPRLGGVRTLRIRLADTTSAADVSMAFPAGARTPRWLGFVGLRVYVIRPVRQSDGQVAIAYTKVTVERLARKLAGKLATIVSVARVASVRPDS